jgi:nucleotide sugar dehydrogenase
MTNITVLGIGRLGLGLALLIEKAGYNVLGIDINKEYINKLNNKTLKTKEPEYENLLINSKNFRASLDLEEGLEHSDIIFIMVQTPNSGGNKFYDHSIVSHLLQKINEKKIENKHIIIGCTLMPKYIDEVGSFLLSNCKNTSLSYNPEFIAQGEIIKGFLNPDMILIGTHSQELGEILREIYSKIVKKQPKYCIISPLEAEITKITINGFITTKLSFANMISDVCDTIGANKEKVLDSIGSDSRIGNKYFRPGYSFGGPCFPRDTRALALFVEQNNINNELLLSTTKYNQLHSDFLTQKLLDENKDEYTIENVCYKEGSKIPIIEESAKLQIAKKLVEKGKKVTIRDEIQLINEVKKEYGNIFNYNII